MRGKKAKVPKTRRDGKYLKMQGKERRVEKREILVSGYKAKIVS